jgi:2'-5' RNA ligase
VWPAMPTFEWIAREFSLVRSDLGSTQSVYTVVDSWPLLDESSKA